MGFLLLHLEEFLSLEEKKLGKLNLKDLNIEELEKILYDINQEKYRAKQIFSWIYRGAKSFNEMTDIPISLRNLLSEKYYISNLKIVEIKQTTDNTSKYLFELEDKNTIESVLMKYKYGYSNCISTQVGCKMSCKFCASTKAGFIRNLSPGEIVDQVICIQKDISKRISHLVFMGIGEPLDNYENTIKALKLLNNPLGLNISYRSMSISTCGLVPAILRLAEEKLPITLSISLHAPNNEIRNQIMPINKKYDINQLLDACRKYINLTKRRVSFEYILIKDLNDGIEHAAELAERLEGMNVHVNLIKLNPIEGSIYKRSPKNRIKKFIEELKKRGIKTTLRRELGSEIEAACGQLRLRHINIKSNR